MPTPSEPPRVWKNEPGRRGGRYWVTSGENVSASSKIIASAGNLASQLLHELRRVQRAGPARLDVLLATGGGRLILLGGEAGRARPGGVAVGRGHPPLEAPVQRRQRQLRVADQPQVDAEVLADLVCVEVDVDDLRAIG